MAAARPRSRAARPANKTSDTSVEACTPALPQARSRTSPGLRQTLRSALAFPIPRYLHAKDRSDLRPCQGTASLRAIVEQSTLRAALHSDSRFCGIFEVHPTSQVSMFVISIVLETLVAVIAVLAARNVYGLAFTFAAYVFYDLARLLQ